MEIRWIASECRSSIHADDDDRLSSQVGPLTNHHHTQCLAEHLTDFTSGLRFLPEPIQWNRLFSDGDFLRNRTIYLTVIVVMLFYVLLMIYSRYGDRQDLRRVILIPLRLEFHSSRS